MAGAQRSLHLPQGLPRPSAALVGPVVAALRSLEWSLALTAQAGAEIVARQHARPGVLAEDLIPEALVGLHMAAVRFDPVLGRFPHYAWSWARARVTRAVGLRSVRLSDYAWRQRKRLLVAQHALMRETGHATIEQLAARARLSLECTLALLGSVDSAAELGEPVAEREATQRHVRMVVSQALAELDERSQAVIALRFGLRGGAPLTDREIAEHLRPAVSRQRIAQIGGAALAHLRQALTAAGLDASSLYL